MIHIYENWYLDADRFQFILKQQNPGKDKSAGAGEWLEASTSYHSRLSQAADFLLRRLQRELIFDRQIENIKDFVADANELHDKLILRFDIIAEQLNTHLNADISG